MTPRERLEAAGWVQVKDGWVPPQITGLRWQGCTFPEDEALAQLARDEAKETSDETNKVVGSPSIPRDDCDANDSHTTGDAAPVATSVSAPDLTRWDADFSKQPYMKVAKNGEWVRYKDAREYASSSSAALQQEVEHQKANYNELKCEAERKVAELTEQVKEWRQITANRDETIIALNESHKHWVERAQKAEDSRDRLQEALRESEKKHQAIHERDRTQVCDGITALKKILREREWLGEGRGPYEWDDDTWHEEFRETASEIRLAIQGLAKLASDFTNCPTTQEEVVAARAALGDPPGGGGSEPMKLPLLTLFPIWLALIIGYLSGFVGGLEYRAWRRKQ